VNLLEKDAAERYTALLFIAGLSFLVQAVGISWLYSQLTGNKGLFQDLGFFEYVAVAWTVVALMVLLLDVVISYSYFNQKNLESKLITIKNEIVESIFMFDVFLLMILVFPVILYRKKRGL